MNDYKKNLEKLGEIGAVEKVFRSIVYVKGLPDAKPHEVIIFENNALGQVFSLTSDYVEVLLLSSQTIPVGMKATRTDEILEVGVGDFLLGKSLGPLGLPEGKEKRPVNVPPMGIRGRKTIDKPFETGVAIVDLIIPLGKGQKELIIGDRKTNKTQFLLQVINAQAQRGTICIYGAIAKRSLDIKMIENFLSNEKINKNVVLVYSVASDSAGIIYLTPYTAMTVAEYFRDKGKDVLLILDDLTIHAKYYREISLLAKRFPGRSAYPGDIFYIHSRLLERSGNFIAGQRNTKSVNTDEVSITCLAVAEMVMGDFSGYIQTNLMSMTDGHIFFDKSYFDEGKRPAINPFLSVTRVGRQAQTPLLRDLNRQITSFLVRARKLKQFLHFGAELSEEIQRMLDLSNKFEALFEQSSEVIIPLNLNAFLATCLWAGFWKMVDINEVKRKFIDMTSLYQSDANFRKEVDGLISSYQVFSDLVRVVKERESSLLQFKGTPRVL